MKQREHDSEPRSLKPAVAVALREMGEQRPSPSTSAGSHRSAKEFPPVRRPPTGVEDSPLPVHTARTASVSGISVAGGRRGFPRDRLATSTSASVSRAPSTSYTSRTASDSPGISAFVPRSVARRPSAGTKRLSVGSLEAPPEHLMGTHEKFSTELLDTQPRVETSSMSLKKFEKCDIFDQASKCERVIQEQSAAVQPHLVRTFQQALFPSTLPRVSKTGPISSTTTPRDIDGPCGMRKRSADTILHGLHRYIESRVPTSSALPLPKPRPRMKQEPDASQGMGDVACYGVWKTEIEVSTKNNNQVAYLNHGGLRSEGFPVTGASSTTLLEDSFQDEPTAKFVSGAAKGTLQNIGKPELPGEYTGSSEEALTGGFEDLSQRTFIFPEDHALELAVEITRSHHGSTGAPDRTTSIEASSSLSSFVRRMSTAVSVRRGTTRSAKVKPLQTRLEPLISEPSKAPEESPVAENRPIKNEGLKGSHEPNTLEKDVGYGWPVDYERFLPQSRESLMYTELLQYPKGRRRASTERDESLLQQETPDERGVFPTVEEVPKSKPTVPSTRRVSASKSIGPSKGKTTPQSERELSTSRGSLHEINEEQAKSAAHTRQVENKVEKTQRRASAPRSAKTAHGEDISQPFSFKGSNMSALKGSIAPKSPGRRSIDVEESTLTVSSTRRVSSLKPAVIPGQETPSPVVMKHVEKRQEETQKQASAPQSPKVAHDVDIAPRSPSKGRGVPSQKGSPASGSPGRRSIPVPQSKPAVSPARRASPSKPIGPSKRETTPPPAAKHVDKKAEKRQKPGLAPQSPNAAHGVSILPRSPSPDNAARSHQSPGKRTIAVRPFSASFHYANEHRKQQSETDLAVCPPTPSIAVAPDSRAPKAATLYKYPASISREARSVSMRPFILAVHDNSSDEHLPGPVLSTPQSYPVSNLEDSADPRSHSPALQVAKGIRQFKAPLHDTTAGITTTSTDAKLLTTVKESAMTSVKASEKTCATSPFLASVTAKVAERLGMDMKVAGHGTQSGLSHTPAPERGAAASDIKAPGHTHPSKDGFHDLVPSKKEQKGHEASSTQKETNGTLKAATAVLSEAPKQPLRSKPTAAQSPAVRLLKMSTMKAAIDEKMLWDYSPAPPPKIPHLHSKQTPVVQTSPGPTITEASKKENIGTTLPATPARKVSKEALLTATSAVKPQATVAALQAAMASEEVPREKASAYTKATPLLTTPSIKVSQETVLPSAVVTTPQTTEPLRKALKELMSAQDKGPPEGVQLQALPKPSEKRHAEVEKAEVREGKRELSVQQDASERWKTQNENSSVTSAVHQKPVSVTPGTGAPPSLVTDESTKYRLYSVSVRQAHDNSLVADRPFAPVSAKKTVELPTTPQRHPGSEKADPETGAPNDSLNTPKAPSVLKAEQAAEAPKTLRPMEAMKSPQRTEEQPASAAGVLLRAEQTAREATANTQKAEYEERFRKTRMLVFRSPLVSPDSPPDSKGVYLASAAPSLDQAGSKASTKSAASSLPSNEVVSLGSGVSSIPTPATQAGSAEKDKQLPSTSNSKVHATSLDTGVKAAAATTPASVQPAATEPKATSASPKSTTSSLPSNAVASLGLGGPPAPTAVDMTTQAGKPTNQPPSTSPSKVHAVPPDTGVKAVPTISPASLPPAATELKAMSTSPKPATPSLPSKPVASPVLGASSAPKPGDAAKSAQVGNPIGQPPSISNSKALAASAANGIKAVAATSPTSVQPVTTEPATMRPFILGYRSPSRSSFASIAEAEQVATPVQVTKVAEVTPKEKETPSPKGEAEFIAAVTSPKPSGEEKHKARGVHKCAKHRSETEAEYEQRKAKAKARAEAARAAAEEAKQISGAKRRSRKSKKGKTSMTKPLIRDRSESPAKGKISPERYHPGATPDHYVKGRTVPSRSCCIIVLVLLLIFLVLLYVFWPSTRDVTTVITEFPPTTHPSLKAYNCSTDVCKAEGAYLKSLLSTSKKPCDNFYEYVCEGWTKAHAVPGGGIGAVLSTDTLLQERFASDIEPVLLGMPDADVKTAAALHQDCMRRDKVGQDGDTVVNVARELFRSWAIKEWPISKGQTVPQSTAWLFAGELVRDLNVAALASVTIGVSPRLLEAAAIELDKPRLVFSCNDASRPAVMKLFKDALMEVMSRFATAPVTVGDSEVDDVMRVFIRLGSSPALAASPDTSPLVYTNVRLIELDTGFKNFLEAVFNSIATIDGTTEVVLKFPDYLRNHLPAAMQELPPNAVANYLGFMALVKAAPFFQEKFSNLRQLFGKEVLERTLPDVSQTKALCLLAVQQVLPGCFAKAAVKLRDMSHTDLPLAEWLSRLESSFGVHQERVAWIDELSALIVRYRLKRNRTVAFSSRREPCAPSPQEIPRSSEHPLRFFHQVSMLQEQKRLQVLLKSGQEVLALKGEPLSELATVPQYDVMHQDVHVPMTLFNTSVATNTTMFSFHLSRVAVRLYRALVQVLFPKNIYEREAPLALTEEMVRRLDELLSCFEKDLRVLPAALRGPVSADSGKFRGALLQHAAAVKLGFRAFRDHLSVRRVWQVDFRLEGLPEFSSDALFFLYYALDNCESADTVYAEHRGAWMPAHYRVNAVLRHVDEFAREFGCRDGDQMALSAQMCRVLKKD